MLYPLVNVYSIHRRIDRECAGESREMSFKKISLTFTIAYVILIFLVEVS